MMYGKTSYNRLSRFVDDEMPKRLIHEDNPRRQRPAYAGWGGVSATQRAPEQNNYFSEMRRPAEITQKKREKTGAAEYGVTRFAPGTRVHHDMFGDGVINSARDMGGDVLYEVAFDNGQTKKLLATYANLKKL
jgi:DNA helicase-2/ATP-dependent DNA helicase PcrA